MAEIISGLFGIDPVMLQRQQQALGSQRAFNYANLSGAEQGQYGLYVGGQLAGQAIQGLLGAQDPQMQKASMAKQLASQFDITTAAGLRQYAQALAQNGALDLAQLASVEADKREEAGLGLQRTRIGIQKTEGDIAKAELSAANEEKLRAELAALPVNASEQQVIEVVRKYGSPDKILQILQRSQDAKLRRAEIASNKVAAPPKPLGASLQKSEDKDLEAIDTYTAQAEALAPSIANLTPNKEGIRKLNLSPVNNAKYMAQNAIGRSTEESRAYEGLKSAVDTAVNLQVSAEKGVQTDKDVLRFANALVAAYGRNDSEASLQALTRYNKAIETAKTKTASRIDQRRTSQNVEPLFSGQQTPTQSQTKPASEKKTRTLKSGVVVTIED
jgi:hypothetical protein